MGGYTEDNKDKRKPLKTTLARTCEDYGAPEVSLQKARVIEDMLLREFKRKYHHYSQHIPHKRNTLEWLSLEEPGVKEYLERFIEEKKEYLFEKTFRRPVPKMFACPQNPFRLNERLTIQKSIFMCPGDTTKPFEDNLCKLQGWEKE